MKHFKNLLNKTSGPFKEALEQLGLADKTFMNAVLAGAGDDISGVLQDLIHSGFAMEDVNMPAAIGFLRLGYSKDSVPGLLRCPGKKRKSTVKIAAESLEIEGDKEVDDE